MAQTKWSTKHVRTLADLPKKLTIGRAYWVDDEHYIVIDHGKGPVIYGNKTGPQGSPGEPIPILQAQIDSLTEASFKTSYWIDELNQTRKKSEELLQKHIDNSNSALNETIDEKSNESIARDEKLSENISFIDARQFENFKVVMQQLDLCAQAIVSLTQITSTLGDNLRGTENTILALLLDNEAKDPNTPLEQIPASNGD